MKFFLSGEIDGTKHLDAIDKKFRVSSELVTNKLTPILESNDYGNAVKELSIIPIIVKQPKEMDDESWFRERKLFKRKSSSADFRLRIDYDQFCNGDDKARIDLIVKNIINSVQILRSRATKDFDGERLEADILNVFK
ncbi:Imm44 family immunity protein [Pseudoalteromonas phenolica]|uniref:Imm44 family immunity protein n=1 Tax=Pseudoalteromonas phenolica TaxID=161398 RepID=UPI00110B19AB|nr:Imm44 family immunity protein [Pseudoalteromonas phenolica]TMO52539.1 dihydrolipoamide succinyltransferase [Pseudoalteromonas phenolica]